MTDPTTEPDASAPAVDWDPASDPDGLTWEDVQSRDAYLDFLLDLYFDTADQGRGALGLTLTVGGAVVSGIAISRAEWIERSVALLASPDTTPASEHLDQIWNRLHGRYVEVSKRRDDAGLPIRARRFVHMRDVRILNGHSTDVSLWRGALADVSGWTIGSWNPPGTLTSEQESGA
ncbi:hypothetical protein BWL13_01642 [Microbacterium oleivorans]|uniref:hypothetical protein n=1 Tax=Microbacterium oleivorans TaxID=273677 RepID=UPI00097819A4|nr:hypothetical protein [Microbacterium oleivorans]AZS44060.1 hypothetical protein BWL13_01642 [Microbacterium oleivorans]